MPVEFRLSSLNFPRNVEYHSGCQILSVPTRLRAFVRASSLVYGMRCYPGPQYYTTAFSET